MSPLPSQGEPLARAVTVRRLLAQGERVPPHQTDVYPYEVLAALDDEQVVEVAELLWAGYADGSSPIPGTAAMRAAVRFAISRSAPSQFPPPEVIVP